MRLSAIIITHNEQENIGTCLASLDFADEIVVVDSGSTDRTEEICRAHPKVRFHHNPWPGFGPQKNHAISLAGGEWIFSLDADEVVTSDLAAEIQAVLERSDCDGFLVKRKNFYRDRWIRYSGWWPDRVLRLFRRGKGAFTDRIVHESVILDGREGTLQQCIEHRSFHSVTDFIKKAETYSTLGARQMLEQGRKGSAAGAIWHSALTFLKVFFLKQGFRDGSAGVLIAFSNAAGVFYRYMKLVELREKQSS